MGLGHAPGPAAGRMRLPAPPPGAGTESWVLGGLICLYCWLLAPATSDLAAAVFRSDLLSRSGALLYNAQWYSGHHLPGYSLLSPLLGALLGTRFFAALCTFGAIVAFERIAVPRYGLAGRIGAVLFAITAGSSLLIGRVAFAAGLLFGPLAVLLAIRARWRLALLVAIGGALVSLLLGLLVAVPYLIWWPTHSVIRDPPAAGGAITEASYYRPLVNRLQATVHEPIRLEIPPTRDHWEGVYVGRHFELARGWERQLDQKYANLFYGTPITPSNYRSWLLRNAVSYVAVYDGAADFAGRSDADFLIQSPPPYLREVWRRAHWTLFAVDHSAPT